MSAFGPRPTDTAPVDTAAAETAASVDWERQRTFIAVLTQGSFSGAARLLKIAQPTVRRRIEDLERQLGVTLFTRSTTGLTPTQPALDLAEPARAMAIAADRFARTASADAGAAAGVVRIAASEVIGVEVLPPILVTLRREHPGIILELGLGDRSEDLLNREADIAVRMTRPTQSALVAKRIGVVHLGLFARRDYLDASGGAPASLVELTVRALIGYETETIGVRALKAQGLSLRRDNFVFRTDNDLAQLAAIRAGIGIGICQAGLAARDANLVAVLPDAVGFGLETWVVMHEDMRRVHRIRLVFDALAEALSNYAKL